ncbi:hypothetical protein [Amaricoccus sp.]|uniref:hypothetical protein n=1 Tax=Amaricoccus sp. TaxID=1872485 RepID=UPI002C822987|nr:hypothetical protein [Amaricoccus sp.]HMQ94241.1 hypothetical protein [Amaricoccus sp.]
MTNFQRVGAISNAHVGQELEDIAAKVLAERGIIVGPRYKVTLGVGDIKRSHIFDLGSESPRVLIECKAHTWTSGGNSPSAKLINWAEAMFYFHLTPNYRRIFFVQRSLKPKTGESLLAYFLRTRPHLVPPGVEFWEYDFATRTVEERLCDGC